MHTLMQPGRRSIGQGVDDAPRPSCCSCISFWSVIGAWLISHACPSPFPHKKDHEEERYTILKHLKKETNNNLSLDDEDS